MKGWIHWKRQAKHTIKQVECEFGVRNSGNTKTDTNGKRENTLSSVAKVDRITNSDGQNIHDGSKIHRHSPVPSGIIQIEASCSGLGQNSLYLLLPPKTRNLTDWFTSFTKFSNNSS